MFGCLLLFTAYLLACNGAPMNLWRTELDERVTVEIPERTVYYRRTAWVVTRDIRSNSSTANSTDSLQDCKTSGLCPEGIANIVAGFSAITILAILACILWHWEVQTERKARIRLALERNKAIDRQMEEDKKRRQERVENFISRSQEESKTVGGERDHTPQLEDLDSNLQQEATSDSELSSDERKELLSNKSKTTDKLTLTAEVVDS